MDINITFKEVICCNCGVVPEKAVSFPWWEVLGVPRNCTRKDVQAAYKKRSKTAHPDNGGSTHQWLQLQEAYQQGLKQTS